MTTIASIKLSTLVPDVCSTTHALNDVLQVSESSKFVVFTYNSAYNSAATSRPFA